MPNTDLLNRTLTHVKNHPETLNQAVLHSGDTCDFLSHAALLSGARWNNGGFDQWARDHTECVIVGDEKNPQIVHVALYAMEVLGLTEDQADELLQAGDIEDLEDIVREICAGAEAAA